MRKAGIQHIDVRGLVRLLGPWAKRNQYGRPYLQGLELRRDGHQDRRVFRPRVVILLLRRYTFGVLRWYFSCMVPPHGFVSLRPSNNATGLRLIITELVPSKVGEERFGPWGDCSHDFMGQWCYFGARTPDDIGAVFGIWGYGRLWNNVAATILPHYGWLEEPLHEGVRWDRAAFSAHAGKYVCSLITLSSHMMKLEPFKPS